MANKGKIEKQDFLVKGNGDTFGHCVGHVEHVAVGHKNT